MGKPITRSSSATTKATVALSHKPSSSSGIPFLSRKIRKQTTKTPTSVDSTVMVNISPSVPIIKPKPLSNSGEIDLALHHLRNSDPLLVSLIETHKPPTFESQDPPFLSLTKTILYQQLAPTAAKSIYNRFCSLCGGDSRVSPETVLSLTPQQLREIGVSGRKSSYLRDLSDKFRTGSLSDSMIVEMDDEMLLSNLTKVKGIGVWSVHMFMMFSLHRPDVLPVGDLGVRKGLQALYGLKDLPQALEMEGICEKWKPYRSVGSWFMWRLMEAKALANKKTSKKRGTK